MWTEIELKEVKYAQEAAKIMENLEENLEVEMLETEILMTVDETGQATPIDCGIMVVKNIQGRPCSCLLKVLLQFRWLKVND